MRYRILIVAAMVGAATLAAVSVQGATPAQFGAKCSAAWTGAHSGGVYGAYLRNCVKAAQAATNKATDAGNPTSTPANTRRANAACAAQFPPPRKTAAKQKAYSSCVRAAIAAQKAFAGRPLNATLKGSNEVPAAGGATGTALIRLNQGQKRVCYTVTATGLGGSAVVAMHIHKGVAGVNGNVVVPLNTLGTINSGGAAKGCEENVDANLIKDIRQHPADYYVNIHTSTFPGGAARGQLSS